MLLIGQKWDRNPSLYEAKYYAFFNTAICLPNLCTVDLV